MDLELSDEQRWLAESVDTLLTRDRERPWESLKEFGALDESLGAVELCLIGRALGAHLTSVPFLGTAALRYVGGPAVEEPVALALLEPGAGWALEPLATTLEGGRVTGEKVAVEHAGAGLLAVLAGGPALALVAAADAEISPQAGFDATVPMSSVSVNSATADILDVALGRLTAVGGLLAAAESVGAAERLLDAARAYASERRQFGRTIGSYQALRHLLADMYVRAASSWSTVLYAAAALDDELDGAEQTAWIAKAYVARAAREVAHGALQVFGGIAFTEEHDAHRYLRRIVVREQQFGDAAFHERRLGAALATPAAVGR